MINICGLWKAKTKDGKTYYSGRAGLVKFLVFQNTNKKSEKSPDLTLCIAQWEDKQKSEEKKGEEDIPF